MGLEKILPIYFLQQWFGLSDPAAEVCRLLDDKDLLLKQGSIVDASMIAAQPSSKNKTGKRDSEMSQTKKATNGALA